VSDQGRHLQDDDDAADPAHKPGDHRERHQADVTAQLHHSEGDLEQPGHHHHREGEDGGVGELGQDAGHDHGHGPGRAGHLGRGTAEQRREQADEDGAVEPGDRAGPRGHPERERQGQGDHGGGQTAVNIAAKVVEM